jgi:hypothetical protein
MGPRLRGDDGYSQFNAPPVWYLVTRVSKKLRSFFRSIILAKARTYTTYD